MADISKRKPNRLAGEKSPYLLQHAGNPVDWFPWGAEAFNKAASEQKPVFLSIGYSTCHWCHVMEKESFEDPEVAAILNEHYIAVKVDREERPDLDQVYMSACQALTGQGGWPLTVILTPEKKAFFAGTYFPKHSRYGINGMMDLLPKLSEVWARERGRVEQAAEELILILKKQADEVGSGAGQNKLPVAAIGSAVKKLAEIYDQKNGGFGGAPKFPSPHQLTFLLRAWQTSGDPKILDMVVSTLKAFFRGGIFDQLGGGMHRYAVDSAWLVPHFEKMLYDQATTAIAALEAYQATGDSELADFARAIFNYALDGLLAPQGAFYAAEDADSEGEEGTFYVWRRSEIIELLGEEKGRIVALYYGVTEEGNFEKGHNILHRAYEPEEFALNNGITLQKLKKLLAESREVLLAARSKRERPFRDDKILTAWNGLFIAALARGAAVLKEPGYAEAAGRAADFVLTNMVSADGRLLRRYRDGEAAIPAFLDDYAAMASALIELYQATFDSSRLNSARQLTGRMLDLFYKDNGVINFSTAGDGADGLPVSAEAYDGAVPSAVSMAAMNLLRLGRMLRDDSLAEIGELLITAREDKLNLYPTGHTYLLSGLDYAQAPPEELVITGVPGSGAVEEIADAARKGFSPRLNLLFRPDGKDQDIIFELCPFLKDLKAPGGGAAAYYCREMHCLPPVKSGEALAKLLGRADDPADR